LRGAIGARRLTSLVRNAKDYPMMERNAGVSPAVQSRSILGQYAIPVPSFQQLLSFASICAHATSTRPLLHDAAKFVVAFLTAHHNANTPNRDRSIYPVLDNAPTPGEVERICEVYRRVCYNEDLGRLARIIVPGLEVPDPYFLQDSTSS
jgi:hypothetical protein